MSYRKKYEGKTGNFYTFDIGKSKFKTLKKAHFGKVRSMIFRGLIFGIFFESLIVWTPIYENSVKKYTKRRLETKKIENECLKQRAELKFKRMVLNEEIEKTRNEILDGEN